MLLAPMAPEETVAFAALQLEVRLREAAQVGDTEGSVTLIACLASLLDEGEEKRSTTASGESAALAATALALEQVQVYVASGDGEDGLHLAIRSAE